MPSKLKDCDTSVSVEMAEAAGEPTAEFELSKKPSIKFKIVSKPVWPFILSTEKEYNLFYARLYVEGSEIEHNSIWSDSPREAMESALNKWIATLKDILPYASDLFANIKATGPEYRTHWIIEGTH